MSFEDKKIKELFDSLKSYSNNKEIYISKIIENVIFVLSNRRVINKPDLDENKIKEFSNYIKSILTELYEDYITRKDSKNNIAQDIEYIGLGFTFITFRVGDNVIKFGKSETPLSKLTLNSSYQVPFYLRESYEIGSRVNFRVEVCPYVETTNISYEDLYETYSNIRDLGYIWNDPKEENMGRIISVDGCKICGKTYLPSTQLKKGDLVLIDLDDIAYVGKETSDIILEEISMMSYNTNVYKFETRYMEEKRTNKIL